MTPREARLLRLVHLRERQHDVAALHLRAARQDLAAAEAALHKIREQARAALLCRVAAEENPEEWLLACADVEGASLLIGRLQAECVRAVAAVQQAAEAESTARRERKGMELTLQAARHASAAQAARAEQRTLDEIVRLQALASAGSPFSRRNF